jgi:HprK-related kinase A
LLEWSMNWCISTQAHQFLLLHSAVIERHGLAVILPAPPGSGKSTLCAALIHRGWRLLSDELALISPLDRSIVPLARPVSLKNESMDVIRRFEPSAVLNRETLETTKGTVSHMLVPPWHLARINETARPGWVIFPKYVAGAAATLTPRPKADSMLDLARNAFNYALLGRIGFDTLADVISDSDCHEFSYSRLDEAVEVFDRLAEARRA